MIRLERIRALTFDCYGTLVDWERGILDALHRTFGAHATDDDTLLRWYAELEKRYEQPPYRRYREVLRLVAHGIAERLRVSIEAAAADDFATSVGSWPPFEETRAALTRMQRRFPLVILSNVDRDLFAQTQRLIAVAFDHVITAEDVAAYKPSPAHFERAMHDLRLAADEILHIGESLHHDVVPARALGIPCVWIHRAERQRASGDITAPPAFPDLELDSLSALAEYLGV